MWPKRYFLTKAHLVLLNYEPKSCRNRYIITKLTLTSLSVKLTQNTWGVYLYLQRSYCVLIYFTDKYASEL